MKKSYGISISEEIMVALKQELPKYQLSVSSFTERCFTLFRRNEMFKNIVLKQYCEEIEQEEQIQPSLSLKAMITAAGMGTRLRPLTNHLPKAMLEMDGETLLKRQIDVYRQFGIEDIVVIKGYKEKMINYKNVRYHINDNVIGTGILCGGMFLKEEEIVGSLIFSYCDIIFESEIVSKLLNENSTDIAIVVDVDWKKSYKGRTFHPEAQAESVLFDNNNYVLEIGKDIPSKELAQGEFIGMLKCNSRGAKLMREYFTKAKEEYLGKQYITAPLFEKAYITDFLQDLINNGVSIKCVIINGGWHEFDTVQDYERGKEVWGGKEV